MDIKNKGITWEYYERFPFGGVVVTPENKKELIKDKAREYHDKEPELSTAECVQKAKGFIELNKKMYDAYLKGKQYFKFKGEKYPVMDTSRLERFKEQAAKLSEKWSNMDEKEKDEYIEQLGKNEEE
jgi:hypothetical protein